MTPDQLIKYIQKPSLLHKISYQELKTLALQYPFSLSLRYLMAVKSKMENHPEAERNLSLLATYSIDRTKLFELMQNPAFVPVQKEETIIANEEYLELKELSVLEKEIEEKVLQEDKELLELLFEEPEPSSPLPVISTQPKSQKSSPLKKMELPYEITDSTIQNIIAISLSLDNFDFTTQIPTPPIVFTIEDQFIQNLIAINQHTSTLDFKILKNQTPTKPTPKTSFKSWSKTKHAETYSRIEKKKNKKKQKAKKRYFSELELKIDQDIATETIAELFANQGYYDKAIRIYEQLGLIFPEKNTYFAKKIEKLSKIISEEE